MLGFRFHLWFLANSYGNVLLESRGFYPNYLVQIHWLNLEID